VPITNHASNNYIHLNAHCPLNYNPILASQKKNSCPTFRSYADSSALRLSTPQICLPQRPRPKRSLTRTPSLCSQSHIVHIVVLPSLFSMTWEPNTTPLSSIKLTMDPQSKPLSQKSMAKPPYLTSTSRRNTSVATRICKHVRMILRSC